MKLANLIFLELRKLRERKRENIWNIKKASHFCTLITKEHLAKFQENPSNLHAYLRLKKGNPQKNICRRQMKQRFGPHERLAIIIRAKFSSRNRTPSNGDCGDIKDLVQGVVCFLEEFVMFVFTDSKLKKSPIPTTQTTRNSATCNVNKICKCL